MSSTSAWRLPLRWLLGVMLVLATSLVFGQTRQRDFDHTKTGFALSGVHANERCESCHLNGVFKGTPRDCATCHTSGARIARENVVRPQRHIPTQDSCDSCHSTQSFSGAKFSHAGVPPGTCQSCHNGNLAQGKPNDHLQTQASCDSCHRSSAWKPAAGFDHTGVTPGTCSSCHNGSRATGKPALHIPSSQSCDDCHRSFNAWRPTAFNHAQVTAANQCSTCHSGSFPPADGKNANHVPYQSLSGVTIGNCDSCHKAGYSAWTPAKFHASVSISTQCATCHNGSFPPAVGKPGTAVHSGVTVCESCHKSTADWSAAKVDHSGFGAATNCASCHNGSTATGKGGTHIPVGATSCFSCHTTSAWKPTKWSHTQVTVAKVCSTCHSGSFPPADGKNASHIPYQLITGAAITNCDSCHKAGYSAWTPVKFHSSVSVSTQCALCHNGNYPPAVGKPGTAVHIGVTVCESCHKSSADWTNVQYTHAAANAVGTGTCDTCHNGSTAKGKTATHIPVPAGTAKCDSCHRSQASFASAVTMSHAVVATATCKSCHNGSYTSQGTTGALAKPTNHIPEAQLLAGSAMDCKACHTSTGSWGTLRMNHNGSQGGGAGWCKACHATGTAYLGDMEKMSLNHRKKTVPPLDCSESGCHRPLGNTGTPYSKWDN